MPLMVRATLLGLAVSFLAAPAAADAVVVTRAMTANTIMEAFVEDERIVVELEARHAETIDKQDASALETSVLPLQRPLTRAEPSKHPSNAGKLQESRTRPAVELVPRIAMRIVKGCVCGLCSSGCTVVRCRGRSSFRPSPRIRKQRSASRASR